MKKSYLILLVAFAAGIAVAAHAADEPILGTWKINLSKSKFVNAPLKSRTDKYEAAGKNGLKYSSEEVDAQDKNRKTNYAAQFDGKFYRR
jgi:hypothetical protein